SLYTAASAPFCGPSVNATCAPSPLTAGNDGAEIESFVKLNGTSGNIAVNARFTCPACTNVTLDPSAETDGVYAGSVSIDSGRKSPPSPRTIQIRVGPPVDPSYE